MSVHRRLMLRTYTTDCAQVGQSVYRSNGRWIIETRNRWAGERNGERWTAPVDGLDTPAAALADWIGAMVSRRDECVPVRRDKSHAGWLCRSAGFIMR